MFLFLLKDATNVFADGELAQCLGLAQANPVSGTRIVTERTEMAMREINIGLFPEVDARYFLPRARGRTGWYLALTGRRRRRGLRRFG